MPHSGDLRTKDLPHLLHQLWRMGISGQLTLRRDQAVKSIFFDDGYPVFAFSNESNDRLEELLLREGKITRSQYEQCQDLAMGAGPQAGSILVERGLIKLDELFPLTRRQVIEIIYSLFCWCEGAYELSFRDFGPDEKVRLDLHPAAMIAEGIRRKLSLDRLIEAIGSPQIVVALDNAATIELQRAKLEDDEHCVLALFDGERSLRAVIDTGPLDELRVYQVAYTALVLRAASVLDSAGDRIDSPSSESRLRDLAVERQRVRTKYAQVCEGDYFALLGLNVNASGHEVRRAYERMRREFDPAALAPELAQELTPQLAEIVAVIDEAYAVLADDQLREIYREWL